jgi:thioester reductase-like protein
VLLTGATGFLGAYLLRELLEQTEGRVRCLLRTERKDRGHERIAATLRQLKKWRPEYADRVDVIPGDLARPGLGLEAADLDRLAESTSAIVHNGALVNWTLPFADLEAANVRGTEEILRLAARGPRKPLHYVSTLGVFHPGMRAGDVFREDGPLLPWRDLPRMLDLGYAQTKWVAEKLLAQARARGLPVNVYRPGFIIGHSEDGLWNPTDFLVHFVHGVIALGAAPRWDVKFQVSTVDRVSAAIVKLAGAPETGTGATFHLAPRGVTVVDLVAMIRARGIAIEELDFPEWRRRLLAAPKNPLRPFVTWLGTDDESGGSRWQVDCTQARASLGASFAGLEDTGAMARAWDALIRSVPRAD